MRVQKDTLAAFRGRNEKSPVFHRPEFQNETQKAREEIFRRRAGDLLPPSIAGQFSLGYTGQSHEADHALGIFEDQSSHPVVYHGCNQMTVRLGDAPRVGTLS